MTINQETWPYFAMGAFVILGIISFWQGDLATAAMNIAIGVALGGSHSKPWNEHSIFTRLLVVGLTLFAIGTFGYIIYRDAVS